MVAYYGGKGKIGKEIAEIILNYLEKNGKTWNGYIEPFCGALGVFKNIVKKNGGKNISCNYYAFDINKDLIMLFNELKKTPIPMNLHITKEQYQQLKDSNRPSAIRAIAGIVYSYSGGWFNGYCPNYGSRNYVNEGYTSLNNMIPVIKKISFKSLDYKMLNPKGYIIYCDPPYINTNQKYNKGDDVFNSEEFWSIVRKWSEHNIVFISELTAPKDFKCIWSKSYISKVSSDSSYRVEKLFVKR